MKNQFLVLTILFAASIFLYSCKKNNDSGNLIVIVNEDPQNKAMKLDDCGKFSPFVVTDCNRELFPEKFLIKIYSEQSTVLKEEYYPITDFGKEKNFGEFVSGNYRVEFYYFSTLEFVINSDTSYNANRVSGLKEFQHIEDKDSKIIFDF